MFIHIGENKVVRKKDIVAIFDMESSTVSSVTKKYLSNYTFFNSKIEYPKAQKYKSKYQSTNRARAFSTEKTQAISRRSKHRKLTSFS